MKIIHLLILSGCALLLGCAKEEKFLTQPDTVGRDYPLRGLLNVNTVSGTIEIPIKAAYMHVTYLKFLDGEYLGTGSMTITPVSTLEAKIVPVELLIRSSDTGERTGVLSFPGRMSFTSDSHFRHNFSDFISGVNELYDGYHILGFASSYDSTVGYELDGVGFENFEDAIKKKKYLLAIGVKFTDTKEEADRVLPETHEAKPEPAGTGQPM